MPKRSGATLISKFSAEVQADGSIAADISFSTPGSAKLRAIGPDWREELRRAIVKGVNARTTGRLRRIVAYVPEEVTQRFDDCCADQHSSRSRVLLGRISRYVDASGEQTDLVYGQRARVPLPKKTNCAMTAVQISAPVKQVKGVDDFCRRHGVTKGGFIMGEMIRELAKYSRRRSADPGHQVSGAAAG
jgi:hypothetical protein